MHFFTQNLLFKVYGLARPSSFDRGSDEAEPSTHCRRGVDKSTTAGNDTYSVDILQCSVSSNIGRCRHLAVLRLFRCTNAKFSRDGTVPVPAAAVLNVGEIEGCILSRSLDLETTRQKYDESVLCFFDCDLLFFLRVPMFRCFLFLHPLFVVSYFLVQRFSLIVHASALWLLYSRTGVPGPIEKSLRSCQS